MKTFEITRWSDVSRGVLCYAKWHGLPVKVPIEMTRRCLGNILVDTPGTVRESFPVVDDYVKTHDIDLRSTLGIPQDAFVAGVVGSCSDETYRHLRAKDAYLLCVDCPEKYLHERTLHLSPFETQHSTCAFMNTLDLFIHEGEYLTVHVSRACEHSLSVYVGQTSSPLVEAYPLCVREIAQVRRQNQPVINPLRDFIHPEKVRLE